MRAAGPWDAGPQASSDRTAVEAGAIAGQMSRRLRVLLLVNHVTALGGAERFVVGLAQHLRRDRIDPWVCSTRVADEEAVRALMRAGIPHISLGRKSKWDVHRLQKLAVLLRRERFDVVHAHMFGSNVWGTLIGRACRVPVVIAHEHTWSYTDNRLRMWLDGHVIGKLATQFIAVSESDRERMIGLEGVPPDKVLVMPTAYIPFPSSSRNTDIRAELGLSRDVPLVGVAAVLRRQKALDVLLEAHARLITRVADTHLVIAGDGPCRGELERDIERLGIGRYVHLLGRRDDVTAILHTVDVAALSSDWEGMPLFVFECMATNTPLVATAVGGLREIIQAGRTGMLVPPRDPPALADALETLLTNRGLAKRLAVAASSRLEEFTIQAIADRFAKLYQDLCPGVTVEDVGYE
jgi:glycosyltransferase involved in cell wall biosynthesis